MVVIQDRLSSVALTAFLCYLFKYALAHTHINNCTHRQTHTYIHTLTLILTYWKRQTLITAHTHTLRWTHTHNAHLCACLSPSPAVFANDALVFLSLNALQNVWRQKKRKKKFVVIILLFLFFKKTNSNLYSKTWASQVDRHTWNINWSSAYRRFHVFTKK